MNEYLALGICLILSMAYVGWAGGLLYALRRAERDNLQRKNWKL